MPTDFIYLGSRKGISKNTNKEYYVVVGYWFDKDSLVHAQEFFVTSEHEPMNPCRTSNQQQHNILCWYFLKCLYGYQDK